MSRLAVALRVLVTLVVVAIAAFVGWQLWDYYMRSPWTRDGRVRADVVQLAPDVSGLVTAVAVQDNQAVAKGDLLFTVDRDRFAILVQEADAAVENRRVSMEQAQRDAARYAQLTTTAVSQAQREQALANAEVAAATYRQALAQAQSARLDLDRTQVKAPVNGYVTNLALRTGNYVRAGTAVLALVDRDSFYVVGYFEETKLPRIRPGDQASVELMGETQPLKGHVQGVARAIADRERSDSPTLVANVNPTFSWVRLAQRVPVRIAIDTLPEGAELVAGRTATVRIIPAAAP